MYSCIQGNNVVRVPLNEDCWLGINGAAYNSTAYQQAIRAFTDLIVNTPGMYAILDLHWTADGTTLASKQDPMPDLSHAVTFWGDVAKKMSYSQRILFELFNEPFPGENHYGS
jgi:hypothetical protein